MKLLLMNDYKEAYGGSRLEVVFNKGIQIEEKRLLVAQEYEKLEASKIKSKRNVIMNGKKQVTVIGTEPSFMQLETYDFLQGSFFGETATHEEHRVAVIGESLAFELFGSKWAVGNTCKLGDTIYQVVGVYKDYNQLRDYYLEGGTYKVFIPETSELCKEWPLEALEMVGTLEKKEMLEKLEINEANSVINNRENWWGEVLLLCHLPYILVLLLLILRLRGVLKECGWCKENKERNKVLALKIGGYMIAIFVVYRLWKRDIYIPSNKLPSDNLFDLKFYWELLKAEWAKHNQLLGYSLSYFERGMTLLRGEVHLLNGIQIALLISLNNKIGKMKGRKSE